MNSVCRSVSILSADSAAQASVVGVGHGLPPEPSVQLPCVSTMSASEYPAGASDEQNSACSLAVRKLLGAFAQAGIAATSCSASGKSSDQPQCTRPKLALGLRAHTESLQACSKLIRTLCSASGLHAVGTLKDTSLQSCIPATSRGQCANVSARAELFCRPCSCRTLGA